MNRPWSILAVSLLVLLAGCGGGVSGGQDGTAATTAAAGDATADGTTTAAEGESQAAMSTTEFDFNQSWDTQYRAGQYYRYEITSPNLDETASYEWEVVETNETSVTIRTTVETSNGTSEQTVTASREELYSELAGSPSGSIATLGFDSPYYASVEGETLEVGDSWNLSSPSGNVSVTVDEIETYADLRCANFVVRMNDSLFWESCVTPESPLPGYVAFYDENETEPAFEMTLVEYRRGD
ncbi:hypothetical protein ACFQJC_02075 [Haloferax namakaokahaiae]|uniref:Lipoprotein n=1 Tax=Haloferax namakaokahaiae TaxID=1748331 RepID=A0ABD5ZBE0_9EURY